MIWENEDRTTFQHKVESVNADHDHHDHDEHVSYALETCQ